MQPCSCLQILVASFWVSIFLGFHALGGYTQRHCPDQFGDKRLTGLLTLFGGPEPGTRISRLSLGERAAYNPISLAAVALVIVLVIVGSGAHAALFLVADYRAWSLPGGAPD